MVNRIYVDDGFNKSFFAVASDVILREGPREKNEGAVTTRQKRKTAATLVGFVRETIVMGSDDKSLLG